MIALVTGGTGFIGSRLIEMLNRRGWTVRTLMRRTSSDRNLKGCQFTRVEGDISDLESLRNAIEGVDVIFHLAGVITARDREGYFKFNAQGTHNLVKAALEAKKRPSRFVYVSSLAAGGPMSMNRPRTENDPDAPVSVYGESKREGERELLAAKDQLHSVILRPPIVYGPRDVGVFQFVQPIARYNVIPLLRGAEGSGKKYYSAIYVDDLCELAIAAAERDVPSGSIFYATGDGVTTLREMMDTIALLLGRKPLRLPVPPAVLKAGAWACDWISKASGKSFALSRDKLNELTPDYWICSNSKAREQLGFTPRFDFSRGMSEAIKWYREKGWIS